MIKPGGIVMRMLHQPVIRLEYLRDDNGDKPEWTDDPEAALFFHDHRDAEARAKQLGGLQSRPSDGSRWPASYFAKIRQDSSVEAPEVPEPIISYAPRAPRVRKFRHHSEPVKLFGYGD